MYKIGRKEVIFNEAILIPKQVRDVAVIGWEPDPPMIHIPLREEGEGWEFRIKFEREKDNTLPLKLDWETFGNFTTVTLSGSGWNNGLGGSMNAPAQFAEDAINKKRLFFFLDHVLMGTTHHLQFQVLEEKYA